MVGWSIGVGRVDVAVLPSSQTAGGGVGCGGDDGRVGIMSFSYNVISSKPTQPKMASEVVSSPTTCLSVNL